MIKNSYISRVQYALDDDHVWAGIKGDTKYIPSHNPSILWQKK